ncbi:hypothetical protein GCM10017600_02540 [Streptosporangium carneum]|uniref:Uncharacterized protein n=1 Tax=Streptosporangium carneum TaxID=47481 RepID=A0A9W6MA24_9ACTN|nr:hypothetical protein GCM10017600_02540 [Streptosporangium carneum]
MRLVRLDRRSLRFEADEDLKPRRHRVTVGVPPSSFVRFACEVKDGLRFDGACSVQVEKLNQDFLPDGSTSLLR